MDFPCDNCLACGTETEATIELDDVVDRFGDSLFKYPRSIRLCGSCDKEIGDELRERIAE